MRLLSSVNDIALEHVHRRCWTTFMFNYLLWCFLGRIKTIIFSHFLYKRKFEVKLTWNGKWRIIISVIQTNSCKSISWMKHSWHPAVLSTIILWGGNRFLRHSEEQKSMKLDLVTRKLWLIIKNSSCFWSSA